MLDLIYSVLGPVPGRGPEAFGLSSVITVTKNSFVIHNKALSATPWVH